MSYKGKEAVKMIGQATIRSQNSVLLYTLSNSCFKLPRMKVPTDNNSHSGVYESVDEYFGTVQRLWVAVTFYDGWSALNPTCRQVNHTLRPKTAAERVVI